jgi:hypothetical protein
MKEIDEAGRILDQAYSHNRTVSDGEVCLSKRQWKRLMALLANMGKRDEFTCGYCAAIADLCRMENGPTVRAGELLCTIGGVNRVKGKGVVREDMAILRRVERSEGG